MGQVVENVQNDYISQCPCCKRTTDPELRFTWSHAKKVVLCDDCGGVITDNPFRLWGILWFIYQCAEEDVSGTLSNWVAKPRKLRCEWSPEAIKDFMDFKNDAKSVSDDYYNMRLNSND